MQWLGFCLIALARQQAVIMASISHCPPPLQLPTGPIWACSRDNEAGYQLPGRPATQLRQAARSLLNRSDISQRLSIPLNPWTGDNDPRHNLCLHLRKLNSEDLQHMMLLEGKLRIGQSCTFNVHSLEITDMGKNNAPLTVQAQHMLQDIATFAQTESHIAVFGAGALAHQIVNLLSDSPITLHWEAEVSERMIGRRAANVLTREPQPSDVSWLPTNSHCLVLTHDHSLDFQLCAALAKLPQISSVGVVGSRRKCQRLSSYLDQRQLTALQRGKIRCPIGGVNTNSLSTTALNIAHETTQLIAISATPASL